MKSTRSGVGIPPDAYREIKVDVLTEFVSSVVLMLGVLADPIRDTAP
jgi:hypothetical protein